MSVKKPLRNRTHKQVAQDKQYTHKAYRDNMSSLTDITSKCIYYDGKLYGEVRFDLFQVGFRFNSSLNTTITCPRCKDLIDGINIGWLQSTSVPISLEALEKIHNEKTK